MTENGEKPCWLHDWTRNQCVTLAKLHTGHSLLLMVYLHLIGCQNSPSVYMVEELKKRQSTWCYSV